MTLFILRRKELKQADIVFYCTKAYSFTNNWLNWDVQDSCPLQELVETSEREASEIVFGCIRDGLFHYVEDS